MKKICKISVFTLLLFISVLFITACDKKNSKNSIVGSWKLDSFVYTFNADNTCMYDAAGTKMKCTYEVDGDKLSILYDGNTTAFETTFSIDGNKLNIKDSFGDDTIYTKK